MPLFMNVCECVCVCLVKSWNLPLLVTCVHIRRPEVLGPFCHLRNAFKSVSQFGLLLFVSCAHCRLNYLAIVKAATHTQHTCNAWLHLIEITVANTQNTQQKRCNSACCAASFPANVLARLQVPLLHLHLSVPLLPTLLPRQLQSITKTQMFVSRRHKLLRTVLLCCCCACVALPHGNTGN